LQHNHQSVGKTWTPVAIWMALIFIFSTDWFAASRTASFLKPLLSWLIPGIAAETIQAIHLGLRKLGHWTEYFVLASLVAAACKSQWPTQSGPNRITRTVILATLYAISDEWHQSFVPSRSASAVDVAVDAWGAICGAIWFCCRDRTRASGDKAQQVAK
jgi:VanZ family protein